MENKTNNTLLNIMGARKSKDGKRINVVLVRGEKENAEYFTCSLALGKETKTTKLQLAKDKKSGEEYCFIKIAMLKPRAEAETKEAKEAKEVKDGEMPF